MERKCRGARLFAQVAGDQRLLFVNLQSLWVSLANVRCWVANSPASGSAALGIVVAGMVLAHNRLCWAVVKHTTCCGIRGGDEAGV